MRRYGYAPGFAAGTVAAGGTLGILIPPSVAMVLYSIITESDLGRLFIAGIIPGLLTITLYLLAVTIATRIVPLWGPAGSRATWSTRWSALWRVWGVLLLFCVVLGGIYFGIFTPTEAAGIGAFGAFLFALFRGELNLPALGGILVETVRTTSMMFVVLIGALLFTNFVNIAGLPGLMEGWLTGFGISRGELILILVVIYLVLGCILEPISIMLLTVPVFFPIAEIAGIDPIWFGVFVVIMTEVGLVTPPIGMNIFVVKSMLPKVSSVAIFGGVLPYIAADVVRIAAIILFPAIVLYLPDLMR
jgi:tripartite ATP-independent transporter DctM subunit